MKMALKFLAIGILLPFIAIGFVANAIWGGIKIGASYWNDVVEALE